MSFGHYTRKERILKAEAMRRTCSMGALRA